MTNIWAEKVEDFDEREEAARLFLAMTAAENALNQAQMAGGAATPEVSAGIDEINGEYRRRLNELDAWYALEREKIVGPDPLAPLEAAFDAAGDAYHSAPGRAVAEDDDGDGVSVLRCALSGAALYNDDETITVGSKTVLASLFVPADVLESLRDDDEDEIEDAA